MVIKYIINQLKAKRRKKLWKKKNSHNDVMLLNDFNYDLLSVGKNTYGGIKVLAYNNTNKIRIGNYCSIAPEVSFILSAEHYVNHISNFPFRAKIIDGSLEGMSKGDIIVDDDVWIGYGSTILSGVHIGQGAVVAAGAVVSKDVPPYAIVGGVPAKIIKYRFSSEIIDELIKVDYSKLTKEMIEEHIDDLYTELKEPKQLSWIPKKNMD